MKKVDTGKTIMRAFIALVIVLILTGCYFLFIYTVLDMYNNMEAQKIQEVIIEKEVPVEVTKKVEVIVKEEVIREVPVLVEAGLPIQYESLGKFRITYYCSCKLCCGKASDHPYYGITASGAKVRQGVTVAVDPKVIPLGTYLWIDGIGFRVAQDTGRLIKGNIIDVYVNNHKKALNNGVDYYNVYTIKEVRK
jgi:3D (Asp-Asp-Asp) domain-containing protein